MCSDRYKKIYHIYVNSFVKNYKINVSKIQKITSIAMSLLHLEDMCVSVSFVHPLTMRSFNKKYRGKNKSTDVLSFPLLLWEKPLIVQNDKGPLSCTNDKKNIYVLNKANILLGDIIISLNDAQKNAVNIGHSIGREVCFLIIHGLLHLVGHRHNTKNLEKLMIEQQNKILTVIEQHCLRKPLWDDCVIKI